MEIKITNEMVLAAFDEFYSKIKENPSFIDKIRLARKAMGEGKYQFSFTIDVDTGFDIDKIIDPDKYKLNQDLDFSSGDTIHISVN